MLQPLKHYKRILGASAIAGVLALSMAVPAFAGNNVTANVTGGDLSTSLASGPSFADTTFGFADTLQNSIAPVTLSAADATDSHLGWHVTMIATDFAGAGTGSIPAAGFKVTGVGAVTVVSDEAVNVTAGEGPYVGAGVDGGLDTAKTVLAAGGALSGTGEYTAPVSFSLNVPAQTPVDSYSSTLTTTIASTP
jgi:hypothetical protein